MWPSSRLFLGERHIQGRRPALMHLNLRRESLVPRCDDLDAMRSNGKLDHELARKELVHRAPSMITSALAGWTCSVSDPYPATCDMTPAPSGSGADEDPVATDGGMPRRMRRHAPAPLRVRGDGPHRGDGQETDGNNDTRHASGSTFPLFHFVVHARCRCRPSPGREDRPRRQDAIGLSFGGT
jgi:hypothetical protein